MTPLHLASPGPDALSRADHGAMADQATDGEEDTSSIPELSALCHQKPCSNAWSSPVSLLRISSRLLRRRSSGVFSVPSCAGPQYMSADTMYRRRP
ncbi:hypothetical protein ACP70R_008057 [Stipagrostis hirtigluma subsp. patula]